MAKEQPYTEAEIAAKLAEHGLSQWTYEDNWIRRKFTTGGWPATLCLVNTIGYLCQVADHHPDLVVTYAKLWVKLQTHSAGGITDKDFLTAKKIDEVALWHPPAPLGGNPDKWVVG